MSEKTRDEIIFELYTALNQTEDAADELIAAFEGTRVYPYVKTGVNWLMQKANDIADWAIEVSAKN